MSPSSMRLSPFHTTMSLPNGQTTALFFDEFYRANYVSQSVIDLLTQTCGLIVERDDYVFVEFHKRADTTFYLDGACAYTYPSKELSIRVGLDWLTKHRHHRSRQTIMLSGIHALMANLIRNAALNYLLDSGIQWAGAPAVKGIRDATIELLHSLVSVHAEVSSGAKPLLEKTLGTLVEGLFDTFLNIFHENKSKDLKLLDPNGFCQLMLELEYFETVLHAYFSSDAREALKSLQGLLLEKATESATESIENPGHHRRQQTRGSEDAMADERQQGTTVSPDDLIALAQQLSADLLEGELERTRLNISCFMESSLQPSSIPVAAKNPYTSFRGPVNSPSYRTMGSPGYSRQRRR